MTDDPLLEATRALRELSDAHADADRFTRQRVLFDVRQGQRRKTRRTFFVIPLAALALGSVAMAATRGSFPDPVRKWVALVTRAHLPMPRGSKSVSSHAGPPAVQTPVPDIQLAPPSAAPVIEPTPAATSATALSPMASNDRIRPLSSESPITEAEFQRYRLAHEAHFVKKDPATALVAWNDYLAHSPSGSLVAEARYNRALCLLKLGRIAEAKGALSPFVAGRYGTYRKQEAQALLATLNADAGM